MPRRSPYGIKLSDEERRVLEARARRYTLPYRDVVRAQMVLLAAQGLGNDEIAARLNTRREVVSMWRKRSGRSGWRAWRSARAGVARRPFPPEVRAEVRALACELPAERGLPLPRLSGSEIAREAVARGICCQISGATIWRWLAADAIRPWRFLLGGSSRAIGPSGRRPGGCSTSINAASRAGACTRPIW